MHLRFVFKQLGRLVAVLGLLLAAVAVFSGIQLLLGHKHYGTTLSYVLRW